MAGLTPEGFEILRLPELLANLIQSEQVEIDTDVNVSEDTFLGQLNNVIGQNQAGLWELSQAVNDNFNVFSAEGTNLDDLAALVGIAGIPALFSSSLTQRYTGVDGTVIPLTVLLENPSTGDRFIPNSPITISKELSLAATYTLSSTLDSTLYRVTLNGTDIDYTSDASANAFEILLGLTTLINAEFSGVLLATYEVVTDTMTITALTDSTFSVEILNYFSNGQITTQGLTLATLTGAIQVPPNSVTSIIQGTAGLTSVTNPDAYDVGRDEETDEELRIRVLEGQAIRGTATVDAIIDELSVVTGVTSVSVYENDTMVVDGDGRPPKSFESFVTGGTDQDIGDAIWSVKAAGIEAFGTTDVFVLDRNKNTHTVSFSRPVGVGVISGVFYNALPDGFTQFEFESAVADEIYNFINALGTGEDILPNEIYRCLFSTFEDTYFLLLTVNGGTDIIAINANEKATIDLVDISVAQAS